MKMFKKGFSIAELLLCLCIIGVVSSIGVTITKHSAEKAYNNYFFTGYLNLYNVLSHFESHGWQYETTSGYTAIVSLPTALNSIFDDSTLSENTVTAKNGIQYNLVNYRAENSTSSPEYYFKIAMYVPSQKSKANTTGKATSCLMYIRKPDTNYSNLFPIDCSASDPIKGPEVKLKDRRDLLPFFLNDGFPARYGIAHYDFVTVFCSSIDKDIVTNLVGYGNWYNCTGVSDIRIKRNVTAGTGSGTATTNTNDVKGVITLGNPNRV